MKPDASATVPATIPPVRDTLNMPGVELWQQLTAGELAALEEIFRVEVANAFSPQYLLPVAGKTPVKIMQTLAAMGLILIKPIALPPNISRSLKLPSVIEVYLLTDLGRMQYGAYCETFDYDDDGNILGRKPGYEDAPRVQDIPAAPQIEGGRE